MSDKKKKSRARPGLAAISDIDRSKYSLQRQTLDAEKHMRTTGASRGDSMAAMATQHRKSRSAQPAPRPKGKKGSFVPSGPPKRNPFKSGPLHTSELAGRISASRKREQRVNKGFKQAFPKTPQKSGKSPSRGKVLKSRPKTRYA